VFLLFVFVCAEMGSGVCVFLEGVAEGAGQSAATLRGGADRLDRLATMKKMAEAAPAK